MHVAVVTAPRLQPQFPETLETKLLVDAVLQPVFCLVILAAICLNWHFCEFFCGLRAGCDCKRALVDRAKAKLVSKQLKTK